MTDAECGFQLSEAREIDTIGTEGIIKRIRDTVGKNPVYLSIDIGESSSRLDYPRAAVFAEADLLLYGYRRSRPFCCS